MPTEVRALLLHRPNQKEEVSLLVLLSLKTAITFLWGGLAETTEKHILQVRHSLLMQTQPCMLFGDIRARLVMVQVLFPAPTLALIVPEKVRLLRLLQPGSVVFHAAEKVQ